MKNGTFNVWGFSFRCRTMSFLALILLAYFLVLFVTIAGLYKLGGVAAVLIGLTLTSSFTIDGAVYAVIPSDTFRCYAGRIVVVVASLVFFFG